MRGKFAVFRAEMIVYALFAGWWQAFQEWDADLRDTLILDNIQGYYTSFSHNPEQNTQTDNQDADSNQEWERQDFKEVQNSVHVRMVPRDAAGVALDAKALTQVRVMCACINLCV